MITIKTNKILIPVDFSNTSIKAIKHGAFIAKLTKGELILLHVYKKNDLVTFILPSLKLKDLSIITRYLEEKLKILAAKITRDYGIKVIPVLATGNVTSEIVKITEKYEVGMVVMGTQGKDSTNDLFLGSNAYRLITKSSLPVMTVRSDASKLGYAHILLPVDSSVHSRQKVMASLEIASKFGAKVHVLGIRGKNEAEHEFKLKVILNQIKKLCKAKKLVCATEIVVTDNRAKKTLSYAHKINADLIICMPDETTEFSRFILGTYSHQLLNNSKIPVLCIPPEEHPENIGADSIGGMW